MLYPKCKIQINVAKNNKNVLFLILKVRLHEYENGIEISRYIRNIKCIENKQIQTNKLTLIN